MSLDIQKKEPISPRSRADKLGLASSRFSQKRIGKTAEDEIQYIKKKHRPQIKGNDWKKQKYYKTNATNLLFECPDEIDREDSSKLSVQDFVAKYEANNKPVVIKGKKQVKVGITDEWNMDKYWKLGKFYQRCKDVEFKAGEDDKGKKLRIKLKYYLQYLIYNKDDSPLYLFESSLEARESTKEIIDWYKVPKYFKDDLFSLAGEKHRPPYRWLLIGPQRSGTTVHIDPLHTSAWNTSLAGHKRWVLFKQEVPKFIVKGLQFKKSGQDIEAIDYFTRILPEIIQKQGRNNLGIQEFIQYPGETVFVPGGWWHAVINLDDTFAVTQNVMTHTNFGLVWSWMRKQRPKFSSYFLGQLEKKKKYLYDQAVQINKRDNWLMGMKNKRCSLSRSPSDSSSSSSSSDYTSSNDSSLSSSKQKKKASKSRSRHKNRQKQRSSKRRM